MSLARGYATLTGSPTQPEFVLAVDSFTRLPGTNRTYQEWVKALPGRRWDGDAKHWVVTATGPNVDPIQVFADAGIEVRYPSDGPLAGWLPRDLITPVAALDPDRRTVRVRPRLTGFEATLELIGWGGVWDRSGGWFVLPIGDAVRGGKLRDGVLWPDGVLEAALAEHEARPVPAGLESFASALASAVSPETFGGEAALADWFAKIPDWFGLDLYPYQRLGALGAALGHNFLADMPGVGKCVAGATRVHVNGQLRPIRDLWTERAQRAVPDSDGVGEVVVVSPGELRVPTLTHDFRVEFVDASHVYRQRYAGQLLVITTESGLQIRVTHAHRFRSGDRWVRADQLRPGSWLVTAAPGSRFGVGGRALAQCRNDRVAEVRRFPTDGYVYDLTVPGTHNYVAEGFWTHNTRTALATAAIRKAERTLILCPPVMTSAWAREATASGVATAGGRFPDGDVVTVVPGRKQPELPERGIVIVPDSTVAARESLQEALVAWSPDVMAYDEAHRAMTMGSKRSKAALRVAAAAKFRLPITGTPMLASPHQLVPQLELSGHLTPVFGGRGEFLRRYCVRDRHGGFRPRRANLRELGARLTSEVWVRRHKADVLPWLPPKTREELPVRVKLTAYREAHRAVITEIDRWLDSFREAAGRPPNRDEVETYADASLAMISRLREAAGICKVPAALEWLDLHDFEVDADGKVGNPVTVWTHHHAVTDEILSALTKANLPGRVGVIRGGTSTDERDALVDGFQDGEVSVLVCSITAAGVGITLTHGCRALFVETDWTPALVEQAEDRHARIGQQRPVVATTMVAEGTLDEHIQRSLKDKGFVLGAVYQSDADVSVTVAATDELATARDIVLELITERMPNASG